jgi:hypothetical protein
LIAVEPNLALEWGLPEIIGKRLPEEVRSMEGLGVNKPPFHCSDVPRDGPACTTSSRYLQLRRKTSADAPVGQFYLPVFKLLDRKTVSAPG